MAIRRRLLMTMIIEEAAGTTLTTHELRFECLYSSAIYIIIIISYLTTIESI